MQPTDHIPWLDAPLIQLVDLCLKVMLIVLVYHVVRDARRLKIAILAAAVGLTGCTQAFTFEASLGIGPAGLVFQIDASADDPPPTPLPQDPAKTGESEEHL